MKEFSRAPAQPRHPIAVVAERTGLSQDVLRIWERRYGAVRPQRAAGGRRLYSDADIERLGLLHAATRAGRSIGQVAPMSTDALLALVGEDAEARARSVRTMIGTSDAAALVETALALTQSLNASALDERLRRGAAFVGLPAFVESVAAPLLRRIGEEWHAGRLSPAHEHLASSVLHDIIVETMRAFPRRDGAPGVLVATPAGERHTIGAALVGAAAAVAGWNVLYLGADLPARDIADAARVAGVQAVAVSIVYVDDRERVLREMRALRSRLAPEITLIAGGAGASALAAELLAMGVRVESGVPGLLAELRASFGDGSS
jgi:DNA-binding transcriptional MerR regulator/methylmalonyl-CoA mutase cobalamin-binding subunit